MNRSIRLAFLTIGLISAALAAEDKLPPADERAGKPRTLNTPRTFPDVSSRNQWERMAEDIRQRTLVSCGLWPMPEKTPLNHKIFDRIEREDYTVEKVHLQPLPGFYLAGNLYRPLNKGKGPFPAILNPHGHWRKGRLEDQALGSIAARCINFAKQGMIAFSYDMVGYNDTSQVNHNFARDPTNQLWSISLMGLQTWNSIRALDFLESLPDVDKKRLGCTGASGGGTQTFMLGAIDDRLAAQAPIVMVSHSMQGGCLCENAPGLRVDYSNLEIAAAPAPRPQLLVSATGDWTRAVMTIEGPAIENIYKLFGKPERFRYSIFDADHNYNKKTREVVYGFFGQWFHKQDEPIAEAPYKKEPDEALRVFESLPDDALKEAALIAAMIERSQVRFEEAHPTDKRSFNEWKQTMHSAWRHTLALEVPEKGLLIEPSETQKLDGFVRAQVHFGRAGRGDRIAGTLFTPQRDGYQWLAVLVSPEGAKTYVDDGRPVGLAKSLTDANVAVLAITPFGLDSTNSPSPFTNFFTTYNRTLLQERVQDIVTSCVFAVRHGKGRKVALVGEGQAGLWCALAAPVADAVIADCQKFNTSDHTQFMAPELFTAGILRMGGFGTSLALAAPNPVLLHNVAATFSTGAAHDAYAALKSEKKIETTQEKLDDSQIVRWLNGLARN